MTNYLHGSHDEEQARLEVQATMFGGASFLPTLRPDMRLLELGCGTGAVARLVAREVPEGSVIGIDLDPHQVETARRLAKDRGFTNLTFIEGDGTQPNLAGDSFDGVYCRYFLEHLTDPMSTVRQMTRLAKPGGWICAYEWENSCYTSYPECPASLEVWNAARDYQDLVGGNGSMGRELYSVFTRAGLSDVHIEARAFAMTAGHGEDLPTYVASAREILGQIRDGLIRRELVAAETIDRADRELAELLQMDGACIIEVMCCATATRA